MSEEEKQELFSRIKVSVLKILLSWMTNENMLNEDCILHDMADDLTDMIFKEWIEV